MDHVYRAQYDTKEKNEMEWNKMEEDGMEWNSYTIAAAKNRSVSVTKTITDDEESNYCWERI